MSKTDATQHEFEFFRVHYQHRRGAWVTVGVIAWSVETHRASCACSLPALAGRTYAGSKSAVAQSYLYTLRQAVNGPFVPWEDRDRLRELVESPIWDYGRRNRWPAFRAGAWETGTHWSSHPWRLANDAGIRWCGQPWTPPELRTEGTP